MDIAVTVFGDKVEEFILNFSLRLRNLRSPIYWIVPFNANGNGKIFAVKINDSWRKNMLTMKLKFRDANENIKTMWTNGARKMMRHSK